MTLNGFTQQLHVSDETPLFIEIPAGVITGKITTSDDQPAASVTVELKGTGRYTTTNEEGIFTIKNLKEGSYTLVVSMIGLKTVEKNLSVEKDGTSNVFITLYEDARHLSQVVVTAQKSLNEKVTAIGKMPVAPKDLPQAITVINKNILDQQQVQSMGDALQNVNGVYVMGNTAGVQEEIAARGYAFGSNNTFKNGARFNNGIKPEFSSVEKVEVLKGGNAILYGNVGAGGVLNIVTKKPRFESGGEISFRTGSFSLYKPSIDVYGPFAKSNWAAYRLNASYETAGSFREGVSSERMYFNPSLLFRAGRHTEILLEGDYLKDTRTPDYGVGAINYEIPDIPRSRFLNVPWAYNKTEQVTATATVTHKLGDRFSLRGVASYQDYNNELFSAARPNASSQPIAADGRWIRGLQKSGTDENYYFASVDLTGSFTTGKIGHTILAGADVDHYRTRATAFRNYANPAIGNKNIYDTVNIFDPASFNKRGDIPFVAADRITTSPILRYGAYVQDLISVLPNLKVLAGLRYSVQDNREATVDSLAKNTTGRIAGYRNSAFNPRMGIVYQPTSYMSLFASYTNSFTINTGVDVNNASLEPSIIDQVEVGIKNDFFRGALSVNLTAYRIHNSNLAQTALFLADGVTPNTNSNIRELTGATVSKGIELDIMSKPVNGFQLVAGYSYNDMRFTEVNGNTVNGNKKGDRLRYNPAHTANASLFYTFGRNTALKGFYLGAGAFYTGDRLAGRNPTNSPTNTNKLMPLPDYVTMDVNAGYHSDHFALRLKLSNLLDKLSYNAHDDNSVNPIAPRQFLATFSYKF